MQRTTRLKRPQVPEPDALIDFDDIVGRPKYAGEEMTSETDIPSVTAETEARQAADQEIWTEIETIEASSDVVDVVATYAELQQYDTSTLHDKDLIKVLQDETRQNAITYYRYSSSSETFSYVGAEGPYYTASETDTLLAAKQDTIIAGTNVQIAADGKTISATDTTYDDFVGATTLSNGEQGLVPAPLSTDANKFLQGDGSWGTPTDTTYTAGANVQISANNEISATDTTYSPFVGASSSVVGAAGLVPQPTIGDQDKYLKGDGTWGTVSGANYSAGTGIDITNDIISIDNTVVQEKLTAGTNVQINGNTISATDTTYADFVGTDGQTAGTAGLVPAPATTDEGEFLKADGTWATPPGAIYTAGTGIDITNNTIAIDNTVVQEKLTAGTNISISGGTISATDTTYTAGNGIAISAQNEISAYPNNISSNDWSALWQ